MRPIKVKIDTVEQFLASRNYSYLHRKNIVRRHLVIFHSFADEKNIPFDQITYLLMWELANRFKDQGYSPKYRDVIRHSVQQYLFWLFRNKLIKTNPKTIFPRAKENIACQETKVRALA